MVSDLERARQRKLQSAKRAVERDLKPRTVHNPSRRRSCRYNDSRFLRIYLPDVFYNPFTSAQEEFIVDCGRSLRFGTTKALAMPRGSGKSTIVKYLQLKYALYRDLHFPLILAATTTKADQTLRDIKAKLRSPANRKLHEDFPFECDICRYIAPAPSRARNVTWGGLPVMTEWGPHHVVLPSLPDGCGNYAKVKYGLPAKPAELGPVVACLGFTTDSLQGLNIYDRRPDFVMLDDLDSRDSLAAEHGIVARKIEECIDKTVAGLGGPNKRLGRVFICTITSRRSAAYRYTDRTKKPAWDGERVSKIVAWPDNRELWEQYIELRTLHKENDKHGRKARDFLVEHFDEMHAGAVLSNDYDLNTDPLDDGEPEHLSALQKCYDYIADNGMDSFLTEHQNDPPEETEKLTAQVSAAHMLRCVGEKEHREVDSGVNMICHGVDIRKIEVHFAAMASDEDRPHRIIDYSVKRHGGKTTTVQQAELLILENLRDMAKEWDRDDTYHDENGMIHGADLTLIDKGWVGTWHNEEGEKKQWATQPVETFCMEMGLRHFLPCKGAPNYQSPKPADGVIIGDHWHMNRGEGKERRCTEVIWDSDHWHWLVEELFMLPQDDSDRIEMFVPPSKGLWRNHKAFGEEIQNGSELFKEQISKGTRSRKPRFVRDHWWDCVAMVLVARSVETWMRANVINRPARAGRRKRRSQAAEIGAR